LQSQLERATPGRRYVVKYQLPGPHTPGEPPPPGGIFFSHVRQGILTVMPTVGDSQPNYLVLDASGDQLHAADFVAGPQVAAALVQSLGFQDKVYLLDAQLRALAEPQAETPRQDSPQLAAWLVDAILVDLAAEQATILKTGWQTLWFSKQISTSLEKLRFLAEYPFELSLVDGKQTALLARLLAGVEFLGRYASRWYESRLFPWGFFRRGPMLRQQTLRWAGLLAATVFGRTSAEQQKLVDEQLAAFTRLQRELGRRNHLDGKQAARGALLAALTRNAIRTDLGAPFPRVLSQEEWEGVRRKEDERETARVTLQQEKAAARATYLVAMGGQPLPGIDARVQAALRPFTEACESLRDRPFVQKSPAPLPVEVAARDVDSPVFAQQKLDARLRQESI
jgi:hypothetical protein